MCMRRISLNKRWTSELITATGGARTVALMLARLLGAAADGILIPFLPASIDRHLSDRWTFRSTPGLTGLLFDHVA